MGNIFWGLLLVLIGLELIVKAVFGVSIPIFRIAFGLFLIYAGVTFLGGLGKSHKKRTISFSRDTVGIKKPSENYQIMFGEAILDLTDIQLDSTQKINITTFFGSTTIIIDQNIPIKFIINTSFGTTNLPDNTQLTCGTHVFRSGPSDQEPYLEIHAKVTFGTLTIAKNIK